MGRLQAFAASLAVSSRERYKQVPVRALLTCVMAWGLHISELDAWIPAWIILACLTQGFELLVMIPFRDGREIKPHNIILGLASTTLMAATFGGMALFVWLTGNPLLATMAALTISGGLLTNIASGIASRTTFFIGGWPYLLALALMPVTLVAQGRLHEAAMLLCVNILGTGSIMAVYQRVYTMRKTVVAALQDSQDRLDQVQAAMAERAAMAAIISHELRTPVSAILAGAEVIRITSATDRQKETADLIIDAGRLMTGMLNDLLDHSKMEAGAMSLEYRPFELNQFLKDAGHFWQAAVAAKGLELRLKPASNQPIWLVGDPYRLRQIVNNLVSNAVKFSTKGEICLAIAVEDVSERPDLLRLSLSVKDQGVGIPSEAMERLFTPFAQASSEVARTYGGTGLGLTVSRDLARLMGGDLSAESAAGEGTCFTLRLNLERGVATAEEEMTSAVRSDLDKRLRVLAVDDHEVNRRTIALVLQPLQVDLATASSGQVALKMLEEQTFDVVLMDVNMPGMDGLETTRRLRQGQGLNCATPIIGFSAGTEEEQIQACYAAGMTDWLAKPLELRKLYEALQRAVPPAE